MFVSYRGEKLRFWSMKKYFSTGEHPFIFSFVPFPLSFLKIISWTCTVRPEAQTQVGSDRWGMVAKSHQLQFRFLELGQNAVWLLSLCEWALAGFLLLWWSKRVKSSGYTSFEGENDVSTPLWVSALSDTHRTLPLVQSIFGISKPTSSLSCFRICNFLALSWFHFFFRGYLDPSYMLQTNEIMAHTSWWWLRM